jgi:hypothetical protein
MTNLQHFALGSNPNHPPPMPNITAGTATLEQSADTPLYPADDSQLLLKNGNFSAPSLGSEDWDTFSGITGWTALSGSLIELQQIEANTTASAGQYGELDAHWPTDDHRGDSDHGIQQTLNLPRGHYLLFFDYRGREHDADAGSFTVKVKSAGSSNDVLLVTKNAASTTTWKRASVSFEITGGNPNSTTLPITLLFDSSDARDSYGAFIDNIMLVPVEMLVDANRDGKMSFTDAAIHDMDLARKEKPFTFWINNDYDKGGAVDTDDPEHASGSGQWEEDDVPGTDFQRVVDHDRTDNIIQWRRDLEDFTRLWISFKGITAMVKQGNFKVKMEWKPNEGDTWATADGSPGIRVFKACEPDGGRLYLEDEDVARQQIDGLLGANTDFGQALGTNQGIVLSGSTPSAVELPANFLSDLTESYPYKHLLFEGYLTGGATNYFNYQNAQDWALTWPRYQLDQQIKPDVAYAYDPNEDTFEKDGNWLDFPEKTHEVYAWAAESWSIALGSGAVNGVYGPNAKNNFDLQTIGYAGAHKWHSGQFRGNNMERRRYWLQLLDNFGLLQRNP